jgi:hypothetical protein
VGPDQGNMWHGGAIKLTPSRLVAAVWQGELRRAAAMGARRRARGLAVSGEARGSAAQRVTREA